MLNYFQPVKRGNLARGSFVMLHLILCSQARILLFGQKAPSTTCLPPPEYVEVTMIRRQQQSVQSNVINNAATSNAPNNFQDTGTATPTATHARVSTTLQPHRQAIRNQFEVMAKTLLEIRPNDDPEYGRHFRLATMPYTTAPVFHLTLAHGFLW